MKNKISDILKFDIDVIPKRLKVLLWGLGLILAAYLVNIKLVIFIFAAVAVAYLIKFNPKEIRGSLKQLSLLLLVVVAYITAYFTINYLKLSPYFIPASFVPMLTILVFPEPIIALFVSIITAIIIGIISDGNFLLAVVFLIGSIVGICACWQARKRSQIVEAGLLVGLAQFFTFAFFNFFRPVEPLVFNVGLILAVNGLISCAIVMLVLPIFEYIFNVVTNISLLELSDINHPLIKKMILEAPGTYHHSLVVGNLSEAAAQSINANSLLARIGSYFHDIGKIEKSNYFSENQPKDDDAHKTLSPSMSKLVIMNHVKDGVELAKEYALKPAIIDFINQHHGTSLTYYFYRRALENVENEQEVQEEPFRYPGPKPQTKETAIVLLADSVEAAIKSLDGPSPSKIKETVKKIINNKFIDGQLDECDLTLKDLEVISEVFVHILSGIYHSRVEYPKPDENKNKKPAKSIQSKPPANNGGGKTHPGE